MANTDQNITELPIKTASEVLDADYMLGIDLVEGYQVSTKDFADYAVNRAAISIGGKTQTTASAISEVRTTAGNAQPKESGKGLSANDFTNAYKSKLDGIAEGAEVNVQSDWNASSGDAAILNKPTTISGYGITDAYTKTQMDTSLAAKSDKSTTYTKTEVDGFFDEKGLVDIEEGTDSEPYFFKASPYGDRLHEKIIGGSVAWNQLTLIKSTSSQNGITFTNNGDGTYTVDGTATANAYFTLTGSVTTSHKYFMAIRGSTNVVFTQIGYPATGTKTSKIVSLTGSNSFGLRVISGVSVSSEKVTPQLIDLTQLFGSTIADYIYSLEQANEGDGVAFFRKLFPKSYYPYDAGSIQSVSGLMSHDTVGFNLWDEEWEANGLNPSTGENDNTRTNRIRSQNFIEVIPNAEYFWYCGGYTADSSWVYSYDGEKNYISRKSYVSETTLEFPVGTKFIKFEAHSNYGSVYNHDICINISDASKNGTYEPYVKHSYPLDSSLTLRGIPKLDENNKLYYDGDTYEADGTVTRKYGIVDLGTLAWYYSSEYFYSNALVGTARANKESRNSIGLSTSGSGDRLYVGYNGNIYAYYSAAGTDASAFKAAMSGVMLVYELATPVEESAHPFQSPQRVTEGGTEEYVTTGIVPVGHESTYVINKAERFDAMPDVAPLDGDYLVRQRSGAMNLVDVEDYTSFVESEESNPITIETDAAQYAKATHLTLAPVQDLHGYNHPWAGGAEKNKADAETLFADYANGDGTYTGGQGITGITSVQIPLGAYIGQTVTYSFTVSARTGETNVWYLRGTINGVSNAGNDHNRILSSESVPKRIYETFTPETVNDFVEISYGSGTGTLTIKDIQLEVGSSMTDYAPYSNICQITPMGHRNLLPMTVEGIKAANTAGAWSENVYTRDGVVFTILADDADNVIGIRATGTASSNLAVIKLPFTAELSGNYVLTGCPSGGAAGEQGTYNLRIGRTSASTFVGNETGNGFAFTASGNVYRVDVQIASVAGNVDLLFQPMIRPASDLDSTFVPYGMAKVGVSANGKNLLKNELKTKTVNGVTFTTNEDGSISLSGTATVNTLNVFVGTVHSDKALILNGYRGNWSSPGIVFHCYERGTTTPEYSTGNGYVELPSGKVYDVSISVRQSVNTTGHIIYPMVRYADVTDDTYEPYKGYTASLDLPEPVYSGTLDLETGEVVVDMGMVDLGTLNWRYNFASLGGFDTIDIASVVAGGNNAKCSIYPNLNMDMTTGNINGNDYFYRINKNAGGGAESGYFTVGVLFIKDTTYTTVESFVSAVSGQTLAYELATPVTYQLTPQQLALFKGINNISTNAKTVQVTYRNGELATTGDIVASTEVAKRSVLGEAASDTDAKLATSLAPILGNLATAETSPTSASHAVGDYLLYNKRLYKVLAAISVGQQLTIGTNVGQTNVAAELASQASAISALNSKIKQTAWGTTLDVTTTGTINGILLIGDLFLVRVWMPSTHDVAVAVETTQGIYRKTGTDTISFGFTSSDTNYTLTRTDIRSFTVTAAQDATLTWIGY